MDSFFIDRKTKVYSLIGINYALCKSINTLPETYLIKCCDNLIIYEVAEERKNTYLLGVYFFIELTNNKTYYQSNNTPLADFYHSTPDEQMHISSLFIMILMRQYFIYVQIVMTEFYLYPIKKKRVRFRQNQNSSCWKSFDFGSLIYFMCYVVASKRLNECLTTLMNTVSIDS